MPVGRTKDAGWQIGVSVTVDHPVGRVWEVLTGPKGLAVWLGSGVRLSGHAGEVYETAAGTRGEIRSYRPGDRIRLTWQPAGWDHETTVQIAVQDKCPRTSIRFHQERLAGPDERERQRTHWKRVAHEVTALLEEPRRDPDRQSA